VSRKTRCCVAADFKRGITLGRTRQRTVDEASAWSVPTSGPLRSFARAPETYLKIGNKKGPDDARDRLTQFCKPPFDFRSARSWTDTTALRVEAVEFQGAAIRPFSGHRFPSPITRNSTLLYK